jgi:S-(hydroxymethyl)glutathione dehydrogenase / alcohol dehydrogenase
VLVVGCGGVGLNVVKGARLAGATPIITCDQRDKKLGYARNFGATRTINATADNVVERVREMTGGLGVDAAFDAIGSEQTALQVIEAVAPDGRAVPV